MRVSWDNDFAVLAARYGKQAAIEDEGGTITYQNLFAQAAGLADCLVAAGVTPGTPVAMLVPNRKDVVWASLGITLSGAAEVPLNPQQSPAERAWCLGLVKARHVVMPASMREELPVGEFHRHLLDDVPPANFELGKWPRPAGEDWGRVLFTSGTTGHPKGAVHSHAGRWLANVMLRLSFPFWPSSADKILLMTPFAHGASLLTYAFLSAGAAVYLMDGVRLDRAVELMERGAVNHLFAPPTVLTKIVMAVEGKRFDTIRTIFTGTATLSPSLYCAVREIFGPVVRVTYGMTEIFNPITVLEPGETELAYQRGTEAEGTCLGWPAPGVELSIRDKEGLEVSPGEVGEVHVRAPHMFRGYVTEDGFAPIPERTFHPTGDLGHYAPKTGLYLVGRKHDVIKTGGYKVFPQEIESALSEGGAPPGLAALGLPSEYWGEVVVAVAETAPSDWLDKMRTAAAHLSKHKRPRIYVSVPCLPRNPVGKVDRKLLRNLILESYRLIDGPYPTLQPKKQGVSEALSAHAPGRGSDGRRGA